MISRLKNTVELSHGWVFKISKYQETDFYDRLFDDSGEGPFEVPTYRKTVGVKPVPDAPKFYI